jgi:hypothetical protein
MTAATAKCKNDAKAIAEVLDYSEYQSRRGTDELLGWLRASIAGGFELPETVRDLVAEAAHLRLQRLGLARPAEAALLAEAVLTMTASEVVAANDAASAAAAQYVREVEIVTAGEASLGWRCEDVFREERDGLICGPLRDAVSAIILEASTIAAALSHYAPVYVDGLLTAGSPDELKWWRESRKLQSTLDILHHTWTLSFGRSCMSGGVIDYTCRPQRPGGFYVWRDAWAVESEPLRYGQDREVLRVASAASQYRLIAPCEFSGVVDELSHNVPPGAPFAGVALVKWKVCG